MKNVNKGCIRVDGATFCSDSGKAPITTGAIIYAKFDGNNHKPVVTPGCKLIATFPSNYGDIYYGADDCLYDATGTCNSLEPFFHILADLSGGTTGKGIDGQCCTEETTDTDNNPYYVQ